MAKRLVMEIRLEARERARSWLVEHYRRQGNPPVRSVVALGITVMAVLMLRNAPTPMGFVALAWGLFLLLRPLAFAAYLLTKGTSKPFSIGLDDRGVSVGSDKGERLFPWNEITRTGLGSDYLWYEIRGGARAIIPFRVMSDRPAVEALFAQHVGRRA